MIYYYVSDKMLVYFFLEKMAKEKIIIIKKYIVILTHITIFSGITTDPSATPINMLQDPKVWREVKTISSPRLYPLHLFDIVYYTNLLIFSP